MQAFLLPLLLVIFALSHTTTADVVTTSIKGKLRLPDPSTPLNSTRLTLNDGTFNTYTQPDGSFIFHRVPPGVHLLDVQSREHHFSQVKIQLLESMDSPKCIEYVFPGATKQAIPHPLELVAHASYEYYEPRQVCSVAYGMLIVKVQIIVLLMFDVYCCNQHLYFCNCYTYINKQTNNRALVYWAY